MLKFYTIAPVVVLVGLAACSESTDSSEASQTVMGQIQDAVSIDRDYWFVGPSYKEIYYEDGRIKPSDQLTIDNKIQHPFEHCDGGPGPGIVADLNSLTPHQLACRVGRVTYSQEVEPLLSAKDRAVAEIPGFLRKMGGMYYFEHRCEGSTLGTGGASEGFDIPSLKQHAQMLQDCTLQEYMEKHARPVTHDDILGN